MAERAPPDAASQMIGSYRDTATRLGARIAELHLTLSSSKGESGLRPRAILRARICDRSTSR